MGLPPGFQQLLLRYILPDTFFFIWDHHYFLLQVAAILKYILQLKDPFNFVAAYQQEQITPTGPTLL